MRIHRHAPFPRALWALALVVLLAHLALLRGMPLRLGLTQPEPPRPFVTRTLPPAPAPAADAPRQPRPTPAAPPVAAPDPAPTAPTDARAEAATTAPVEAAHGSAAPTLPPEPAPQQPPQPVEPAPPALAPAQPPSVASQFTLPGAVRLKYAVESNKFPFSANGELLWQQDGETYEMQQEWGALGLTRVRTSRGRISPAGLEPERFSDKYRSEVAAHFEREKGKISFSANTPDAALQTGAQDQLSLQVQLAALLAGNPGHFAAGVALSLQVAGPRAADTWVIAVVGEEKLILPGGELMAIKLVRNPDREYDQKLELWMAPSLHYLPARIRITEPNGDYVEQKWLATEPLN